MYNIKYIHINIYIYTYSTYVYIHMCIYIYMSMFVSFWSKIPSCSHVRSCGSSAPTMPQPFAGRLDLMAMENPWENLVFTGKGLGKSWKIIQWMWKSHGYGSIPIDTIFRGMNIHLPAILMFTRGTRFWHTATYLPDFMGDSNNPERLMVTIPFRWWRFALSMAERLRRSAPWAAQIRRSSRNLRCIWIRMEAIEQLGWARAELMEFASNIWYMEFTLW